MKKKEYIEPRMKVVEVRAAQMLCGSYNFNSIINDSSEEDGIYVD